MEPITDKQIKFLTSLAGQIKSNVPKFDKMSKTEAKILIQDWLEQLDKPEVVKIPDKPKNGREFHLSIEECRARAIELTSKSDEQDIRIRQAKIYFDWIWKGEGSNGRT